MSASADLRLPKGSTILITGVTGYIGSWVAHELLALGYNVHGAVRNIEKAKWLQEVFDAKFGAGHYSPVLLTSLFNKDQLTQAVEGVAGIANIAINPPSSPEPEPYVQVAIDEGLAILEIAEKTPSVKAVVLTSSSMAAAPWGVKGEIAPERYNEEYIGLAYNESFTDPGKPWIVYAAAKAKAEQAAWKWYAEHKPSFSLNQTLPSANFGPALSPKHQGGAPSTGGWPKMLYDGDLSMIQGVPAQYFIDVRDDAKLHVAGLLDAKTNKTRLFGFGAPYNWNLVLAHLKELYPGKKFVDELAGQGKDESIPPTESALKALKNVFGQEGWTPLKTALKDAEYDKI